MKEKILGALLALSPFSKGEAQEAKIAGTDKVSPKIEETQEKPAASKLLKDKKTANPWKLSLETNVSLVNDEETISSEAIDKELKLEQEQKEKISTADHVFGYSTATNNWFKDLDKTAAAGGLGNYGSLWEKYKQGTVSAAEASSQLFFGDTSGSLFLLRNYFSQAGKLEKYKSSGDFAAGAVLMSETLSSLNDNELSVEGVAQKVKEASQNLSYEAKLGALAFFSRAINENSNPRKETPLEAAGDATVMNEIVALAVKYLRGDVIKPGEIGVCRHLAALTSGLAQNGLGLNAVDMTTDRHVITQIKQPNGEFILLDGGHFISSLDGHPLLTKNDVDAAAVKNYRKPPLSDLTIEAGGDKVLYENRYNNFAGLMRKLSNRDNLSLRAPEFIAGEDELSLFPRLSEKGVTRGAIEKGNIGLQAYWLRDNNEYKNFIKEIKGLNLAAYVPAEFSLGQKKFDNIFFANLGFYRSVLDLTSDHGGETKTSDATLSLENYLRCSLNTSLTAGLIAKLADFNLELNRSGEQLHNVEKLEYHGSISPFISFEIPGGAKKSGGGAESGGRTYLCSGLEITDYLTLPNAGKLSAIPWFQAGFEYNKKEIDLGLKLRGELQPASTRFDLESFIKKGANQLELRAFSELYNQKFKELTPYKNIAGIEAGVRHDLENGHSLFLMLSAKSGGGDPKQILLNLGLNF